MPRIEGQVTPGHELNIKRLYLNGVKIIDTCPQCGGETTMDLSSDYLSNPKIGELHIAFMYCPECDDNWDVSIVMKISVELAEPDDASSSAEAASVESPDA